MAFSKSGLSLEKFSPAVVPLTSPNNLRLGSMVSPTLQPRKPKLRSLSSPALPVTVLGRLIPGP